MKKRLIIYLLGLLLLSACDMQKYPAPPGSDRKEILIYCGMTMVKPVLELSRIFEEQENCVVKVTYGGSGHLLRSIEVNRIGDLFFPGKKNYIDQLADKKLIENTALLGYNQAALFVQPGNPKQITAQFQNLTNPDYRIVIGSEQSGSIGKETKRILDRIGIYQDVIDNALYLTTDSKGLVKAIKNHEADLVVNWLAVNYLPDNKGKMDVLKLSDNYFLRNPLLMGTLAYSDNPDLADKFLQLAASEVGQNIFRNYGFLD